MTSPRRPIASDDARAVERPRNAPNRAIDANQKKREINIVNANIFYLREGIGVWS